MGKIKKIFKLLPILIIGTLLLTACSNDENAIDESGFVKFTFDGNEYSFDKGGYDPNGEFDGVNNQGAFVGTFYEDDNDGNPSDDNRKMIMGFSEYISFINSESYNYISIEVSPSRDLKINLNNTKYRFDPIVLTYTNEGTSVEERLIGTFSGAEETSGKEIIGSFDVKIVK